MADKVPVEERNDTPKKRKWQTQFLWKKGMIHQRKENGRLSSCGRKESYTKEKKMADSVFVEERNDTPKKRKWQTQFLWKKGMIHQIKENGSLSSCGTRNDTPRKRKWLTQFLWKKGMIHQRKENGRLSSFGRKE